MIIGACGYGASGSSVLTDLLHEYDGVQVFDSFEFVICYRVDGIQDLEYHLMKQYAKGESGDFAIKRFLEQSRCYLTPFIHKPCDGKTFYRMSKEFINSIVQLEFNGVGTSDVLTGRLVHDFFAFASKKILMPKVIERMTGKTSYVWPCRKLNFCIEPNNFYDEAKRYVSNIIREMGADMSMPVVLDQPFEGNCPEQSFPFFDDPYAVVIDRDPRDMFIASQRSKGPDGKFYPRTNVDDYIIYYKNLRKRKVDNPRVLYLNFEDLIYEYDLSVSKIENFLHLGKHTRVKENFKPSMSVNNTQLIRLYPEYAEAIKKIERNLTEFLYPFDRYPNVEFKGKPFIGAARKITYFP